MPFRTLYNPPAGVNLSASLLNGWRSNNSYLWGLASRTFDVFTGARSAPNTNTLNGEVEIYRGYFRYAGRTNLRGSITRTSGRLKIYITHNGDTTTGWLAFNSNAANPTFPLDVTSSGTYAFTVGTMYRVRITLDRESSSADARIDYLAIETSQAYSWPSLISWTNGTTPSATDFANINTAQLYLRSIGEVPTGNNAIVWFNGQSVNTLFYNGGFYYTGQTSLEIAYRFYSGTATLKTYAVGSGTAIQTVGLTSDQTEHTDPITLTGLTQNNFYRVTVESNSSYTPNYVKYIHIGGTRTLSNNPATWSVLDTIVGSTGAKQLYHVGRQNLDEIRTQQAKVNTDYGFQFLAPGWTGTVYYDENTEISYSIGPMTKDIVGNTINQTGVTCAIPHVYRYLWYLPKSSGATGTLTTSAGVRVSLPDNASGGWNYYDTEANQQIAYGQRLELSDVMAAFEATS